MTALLALLSALFIGSADFLGGRASRSANGIHVAAVVAVAGLPLTLVVAAVYGAEQITRADVLWAVVAGCAVAAGLCSFYVGMGRGLISIVAPVAAVTGAVIPVVYGLALGERPRTLAVVGLLVAFVAVAVVSLAPSEQHPETPGGADPTVIALALTSGVFFGAFYIAFSRISEDAGLWPIPVQRTASIGVLVVLSLVLVREPLGHVRRLLPTLIAVAALEVAAAVPLLLALQRGPVAIASVLASLYPVATVLLAAFVLRERLSRLQFVGVVCALCSVALVSSA